MHHRSSPGKDVSTTMAYARMQFPEMTDEEHEKVINGLPQYCELDMYAMVLLREFFKWGCN